MAIYSKSQPESLQALFASIAGSYDRTNAILSFRQHHRWNRALIAETIGDQGSGTLADLCCGTGAIALSWLRFSRQPKSAYLIDFCSEMLDYAKFKAEQMQLDATNTISYVRADVQQIPLDDCSVDFATMAYGIRNVESPERCFAETFRILKPGATFGILELTEPTNAFLHFGHRLYLRYLLPLVGKIATSNGDAYRYLSESITAFSKPQTISAQLRHCGFKDVRIVPLSGGIATLIIATR
jgi:demethylmenaquinone methyltransferase/2-methoxy-6-polyprenyl-1,4-benzoquinol methylase